MFGMDKWMDGNFTYSMYGGPCDKYAGEAWLFITNDIYAG